MDDLKKLLLHGISRLDIDDRQERPMSIKEEKAALEQFSEQDFPDAIYFSIIKEKPEADKLFSKGAFNRFLHILRLYVGGRILGHFNKTKKPPEVAIVHIQMEYLTKEEFDRRNSASE